MARRKRKPVKRFLIIGAVVLCLLVAAGVAGYLGLKAYVNQVPEDTICENVYIDELDVSGMKADEAKAALEQRLTEYQAQTVNLKVDELTAELTFGDMGFSIKDVDGLVAEAVAYGKEGGLLERYNTIKDLKTEKKEFAIIYVVDETLVESLIKEKFPELSGKATDATISREDGSFVITDEAKGIAVDAVASAKKVAAYFEADWKNQNGVIELVTTVDEPKVTRAQLEQIQDLLGSFTTTCGYGGGRVKNIVTGAGHINGAVLLPGEEYSANAAMEPYTDENGYAEAGSYENGKVVQSMGGGICQVSTTLYNAVILAELEIVERAAHSMLVSYVEPSMDAAIAGDFKDLKFKNNTDAPIYIEGYVSGGKITFNVYGKETRSEDRTVEYVSEVVSSTPAGEKFVATGDAVGTITKASSGYTGMKAKLWKVVKEGGVEVSRKVVNNSTYSASAAVFHVGTSSSFPEVTQAMNSAVASQSRDAINAAIALQEQLQQAADDAAAAEQAAQQGAQQEQTGETGAGE